MSEPLYSLDILRLATGSAEFTRLENPDISAERRSPTCGSRITVDIRLDSAGRVTAYGHEVRACALGQAASTLLAHNIIGSNAADLVAVRDDLARWLADAAAPRPDWPSVEQLERARPYPARHAAIRLAFDAAAEAVARVTA